MLAAVLLVALVAAAVAGWVAQPPGAATETASVDTYPPVAEVLLAAGLPSPPPRTPAGVTFRPRPRGAGGGTFTATGETQREALNAAWSAAIDHVRLVTEEHRSELGGRRAVGLSRAERTVTTWVASLSVLYPSPEGPDGLRASAVARSGAAGLALGLAAALAMLLLGWSGALRAAAVALLAAAIAVAAVVAAAEVALEALPAAILLAVGVAAVCAALAGGRREHLALLGTLVVLAPLRGLLLLVVDTLGLEEPDLFVNALPVTLVGALALATLVHRRAALRTAPRVLLAGWGVFAVVSLTSVVSATVGPDLFAIGVVQYLTYPTLALAVWALLGPDDLRKLVTALVGMGTLLALTVFVQAAGVTDFVQSAAAEAAGLRPRYAGATGSYLHTGIFLGVCLPLSAGLALAAGSPRAAALPVAAALTQLVALSLSYGRAGFVIAASGFFVLLVTAGGQERRRLAAVLVGLVLLAVPAAAAAGVTPGELGSRIASIANWDSDEGNRLRLRDMRRGVERATSGGALQNAFGEGPAATGNAKKLAGEEGDATESFVIKMWVETGLFGGLLVVSLLGMATFTFLRTAFQAVGQPVLQAAAAAGAGLSIDSLAYQTLEVQLIALSWWALLAAVLRTGAGAAGRRLRPGPSAAVAGTAASGALAFVAAVLAIRDLDLAAIALFGVGLAVHSLGTQLADLGMSVVAARELAGGEDRRRLARLTLYRLGSSLLITGALAALALAFSPDRYESASLLGIAGVPSASAALFSVAILQARGAFGHAAAIWVLFGVTRVAATAAALLIGGEAPEVLAGYCIAAPTLTAVAGLACVLVTRPRAATAAGRVASVRAPMILAGLASAGVLNLDVLIMSALGGDTAVAEYTAAWRVAAGIALFNAAVAAALIRRIMVADDVRAEAIRLLRLGLKLSAGLLLLSPLVTLVGRELVGATGEEATPAMFVLCVAFALDAVILVVYQVYVRSGRAWYAAAIPVVELVVMAAVTAGFAGEGSIAPAAGQLAARACGLLMVLIPLYASRGGRPGWFGRPETPAEMI